MRKIDCFVLLICLICSACGAGNADMKENADDSVKFAYAENISIEQHSKYKIARLKNPWKKGQTLHTYILIDRKDSAGCSFLPEGTVIYTPLRHAAVFVSPHAALTEMLGAADRIAGIADLKYMQLPGIKARVMSGKIADCGESVSPDMERIIDIRPDAVFVSPFENSGGYGKLDNLGIPIVECADYMETSALGRAEWMRFYGMLFGKEREADSLFAVVDSAYNALAAMAGKHRGKHSIITEKLTGTAWYVPGGRSSAGRLIADAGGNYAFAADKHSGSLAMSFESILDRAGNADVWLFNHSGSAPMTYQSLLSEYHGYASLKAFRNRSVWFVNSTQVPYFEEISFRPDYLLRDYIILLHPDMKLGKPRYFNKVML